MPTAVSVIIPTYNEAENIRKLIPKIFKVLRPRGIDPTVIVVDDDSPDKTWQVAEELSSSFPVVSICRKNERGLSSAVIGGLKAVKTDIVGFMDADFSHPPEQIADLVAPIIKGTAELVIGSRYVDTGVIGDWPWQRRLASKVATLLAWPFTRIKDPMSGFVFFKRSVVEGVPLNPIGFKIGLEIVAKGKFDRMVEVPITFKDRLHGESKLSSFVIFDYLKQLCSLYLEVETAVGQFVKFGLVGMTGLCVNLTVFSLLVYGFSVYYMFAAVIAFIFAVTNNFILNRRWTFHWARKGKHPAAVQFSRFILVCLGGLAANLSVLYILAEHLAFRKIIAQVIAIAVATTVNFVGSKKWVFIARKL